MVGSNFPSDKHPLYNFGIDSKVFCDLVELCLSYNQFHVEGKYLRQTDGLFMGSSISPPLAQIYLEYFETYLYEPNVPDEIKPSEWERFVDDCIIVYEHSDRDFDKFLGILNSLDDHIKFTCERSKPGVECGFSGDVVEAIPFLDFMVMRYLDPQSKVLSNKICIYRKPCHKGSYIHAHSTQPTSTKRAVIRNMFLRAFRYCDTIFLEEEVCRIYADFEKLGYTKSFIDKAKLSAREGRDREVRIREGIEQCNPPRERSRFHINLPYNRASNRLSYRFGQRGIDVTFTNRDSIRSRVTNRIQCATNSGIYVLTCKLDSCEKVYVGQSHNIPKRLSQHTDAKTRASMRYYTSVKHTRRGHELEPANAVVPYKSNSLSHRLIIETCLISLLNTVPGNKASSDRRDMNILAPVILKASPIDWKIVAEIQPSLNPEIAPRTYRKFFSPPLNNGTSPIPILSTATTSSLTRDIPSSIIQDPPGSPVPHNYFTRSKARSQR